jgi:peptidoglycan-associated lipoprotein
MKYTRFVSLTVIGIALSLAALGCKHNPTGVTPLPGARAGDVPDAGAGGALPGGAGAGGDQVSGTPQPDPSKFADYNRDDKIFEADTVQFEYDSSVVRSSEKSKVANVASHLKDKPAAAVEIEGHCDERGTDQYNYSLGERRALAVREELILAGVDGSRILTKSFGRSRPIDTGHSEAAHARNRRGAFILLTK